MITPASKIADVEVIPSGLPIARAIGIGGLPKSRIVEVVGFPGVGKSTICEQEVANAQAHGEKCLWVDGEGSFTPLYAKELGLDVEALDVLRGDNLEEILNEVWEVIVKKTYGLIVIDSIGELVPRATREKQIGETVIGGQAKPIGQFVRNVAVTFTKAKDYCCLIGINQLTSDLMTGREFARGGSSWNHHKAVSIKIKKAGKVVKQGENVVGFVVSFETREKNKMKANVGQKFEATYMNGQGFSGAEDLLQQALDAGVITKSGNTFYMGEEKLGMISALREKLKDESFHSKVKNAILDK